MNISSSSFLLFFLIFLSIFPFFAGQRPVRFPTTSPQTTTTEEMLPTVDNEFHTGFEGIEKQFAVMYEHGSCGTWDDDRGEYVPDLKNSYDTLEFSCTKDFRQWAQMVRSRNKICGDSFYELRKQCIMVHAFDNGPIDKSAMISGHKKDVALVLFDGCTICNFTELYIQQEMENDPNMTYAKLISLLQNKTDGGLPEVPPVKVEIWASYEWKEGSRFTKCYAETKEGPHTTMNSVNAKMFSGNVEFESDWIQTGHIYNAASFYQRICFGIFSADDMANHFEGVKLHIKHNCNFAGEFVDLEYSLPDIVPGDHPNHIAEMRGLKLSLHENRMSHVHFYPDGSHVQSNGLSWDSLP